LAAARILFSEGHHLHFLFGFEGGYIDAKTREFQDTIDDGVS
jgi:hypothetical protein